jgi:hypothetical protein
MDWRQESDMWNLNYSILIGIISIAVIYLIYAVLTGAWSPAKLFEGADGRLSLSKFQWWLWIWIIAFSYITIYAARCIVAGGLADPITDFPPNVLWILGISTGTMTVAKGITSSYVSSGAVAKSDAAQGSLSDLVVDDGGSSDLSKLQMFIWTLIAVVLYLVRLITNITTSDGSSPEFPDLDQSLLYLSGLSATGYLGKKVVTRDAPRITGITPSAATGGQPLTLIILGANFGPRDPSSLLAIGSFVGYNSDSWDNQLIRASLPSDFPKGTHTVSVIVGGVRSNELALTLS